MNKILFVTILALFVVFASGQGRNGEEHVPSDEAPRIVRVGQIFGSLMQGAAKKGDPWLRNAHAKQMACVRARLNVSSLLTPDLAQGIFKEGASYPTFIRFSNGAGRGFTTLLAANKSDAIPDNRGMALKIFLPSGGTQDFLLTTDRNGFLPDAATAEGFFQSISEGTLSSAAFLARNPKVAANLALLGVHGATTNLLKTTFWQQVPSRYGAPAAKFMLQPCAQNSKLPDGPSTLKNFLADNLYANLNSQFTACFVFYVQFFESDATTPIEDSTVQWNTPWHPVATLELEPYGIFSFGPWQQRYCESMSFNPWHSIPDHQPLGSLNRIRKVVYTADAQRRHGINGQPNAEPTVDDWEQYLNHA